MTTRQDLNVSKLVGYIFENTPKSHWIQLFLILWNLGVFPQSQTNCNKKIIMKDKYHEMSNFTIIIVQNIIPSCSYFRVVDILG